ncbi:MAG TPA: dTMP kinase [Acidimicrobiia bacterium]|nr:dTMP kinase [Acidimicrobiia bacterium]
MSRYAAIEGVDGAGKSTVAAGVAAALQERGHDVVRVREPGGTAAGEAIRAILLATDSELSDWTEALLFAAARAQLAAAIVGPALESGKVVVSDRSVYSSLAYQGAGRGLPIDAVREVNRAGLGDVWPDTVILLRLDPEHGLQREDEADRISLAGARLHDRVARAYDELAEAEPGRFVVIDGSMPVDEVIRAATEALRERWS